jgi:hypothetical protein
VGAGTGTVDAGSAVAEAGSAVAVGSASVGAGSLLAVDVSAASTVLPVAVAAGSVTDVLDSLSAVLGTVVAGVDVFPGGVLTVGGE